MCSINKQKLQVVFGRATQKWINSHIPQHVQLPNRIFHYTKAEYAKSIIDQQEVRASFIRSTSDPLEYALPLSEVRDWVCFSGELWDHFTDPTNLFCHFNLLAENPDPKIRPYFVSMVKEPNKKVAKLYGETCLEINAKTSDQSNYEISGFFLEVIYPEDMRQHIQQLLRSWRDEVLHPVREEYSRMDERDFTITTFPSWMRVFQTIPLFIKKKIYDHEKEVRLIIFPGDPDRETPQFGKRVIIPSDNCRWEMPCEGRLGQPRREYLPVKLAAIGLSARIVGKNGHL